MNPRSALPYLAVLVFSAAVSRAEPPGPLQVAPAIGGMRLQLPNRPWPPVGGTQYRLQLETSDDLISWKQQGELTTDTADLPTLQIAPTAPYQFFRLNPKIEETGTEVDGAELYGYGRIFDAELSKAGFLTPEQFAAQQPGPDQYRTSLSFDPTTAQYWSDFNLDPAVVNSNLPPNSLSRRLYDFRLNLAETALFKTNGFMVSGRLGAYTFGDLFYRVFADDLPVYISADSALHAWHFSFERILEEAEETQFQPTLQQILGEMHARLAEVPDAVRQGPLAESLQDADYYLAVARSLLSGNAVAPVLGDSTTRTNISNALKAVAALQLVEDFPVFGSARPVDFSQFTIRGHYTKTLELGRYFQAMMWTARVDFQVLNATNSPQSLRELGTSIVLCQLILAANEVPRWEQLERTLRTFIGPTDAMTFFQLQAFLYRAGIPSLDSIASLDQLVKFQNELLQGDLGVQLILSDVYGSPFSPEQTQVPPNFVLTGQRFTPDAWTLGQVIFDRIRWNEEIPGYTFFKKVIRRYPSALDVAYAVLRNQDVGSVIAQRMLDVGSRSNFRDGLPYAHNLTALAATFDQLPAAAWEDSIYTRWLGALRELSSPTSDPKFPEAMQTRAWRMHTLNTQLASYTELKHDTVLYTKQPYAGTITCEYPAGFVEPIPAFWAKMKDLANFAATNLWLLQSSGVIPVTFDNYSGTFLVDLGQRQSARIGFCQNFAAQMAKLEGLANKELAQQPFTDDEVLFIRNLMNRRDQPYGGPTFDGWYPGLFYKDYRQLTDGVDSNGCNKWDALVTDVETAPPDLVDPQGGVLHEATGNVDLLMIAVDNGPDRMVYAGPVSTYYEFIVPGPTLTRLTDEEWQSRLIGHQEPPRPDWTESFLAPPP